MAERLADKYELGALIRRGPTGTVYEGVHVDLGKRLAIKLIRTELGRSADADARFKREARAASAVESDYVAQIIDFGRDATRGLYMVIEHLDGEVLEERLLRERWVPEIETATLGLQVARGLSRAHAVGVLHGGLGTASIFLARNDDGSLLTKILDLGVSHIDADRYTAPEQHSGKDLIDGRADVWSLCAVLYEMIAGEPAIPDGDSALSRDIPPLASRAEGASSILAEVIDAGLRRDRDKRIGSALELASELLAAHPGAGSKPSLTSAVLKTDVSDLLPQFDPAHFIDKKGTG